MLLATVNSGTLIIALPDLERALGTSLLELVWVILAYMIASTVLVLTAGRLSDLFGRKRPTSPASSCSRSPRSAPASPTGTELILWRIVQGVGGAFLFANSAALVTDAFPREQLGLAMGTNTMVAAVGLVIGPVLGGALVAISWHWVFWFNVPLGLAGAVWGALVLHELPGTRPADQARATTCSAPRSLVGLTGLVLGALAAGSTAGTTRWSSIGLIAAALLLPAFVLVEAAHGAPMLDLQLFREPAVLAAATAAASSTGCPASPCCSCSSSTSRAPRATTRSPPGSS